MDFITLMHTRELIVIYNIGNFIMGRGVEGKTFVVSQSVGDSQPSTNIKGGYLTAVTRCLSGVIS